MCQITLYSTFDGTDVIIYVKDYEPKHSIGSFVKCCFESSMVQIVSNSNDKWSFTEKPRDVGYQMKFLGWDDLNFVRKRNSNWTQRYEHVREDFV